MAKLSYNHTNAILYMFSCKKIKGHVNGKKTREVFSYLKKELPNDDGSKVSFLTLYCTVAYTCTILTQQLITQLLLRTVRYGTRFHDIRTFVGTLQSF